ncbi:MULTISPECIES: SAM-dependent methyltransferase [Myxococcus]|uniref:RNA methyltransferase n=1 Tax=Myxococcus xanthus TaxID=34 RepID=A0AAE6KR92_MYXXA|nr:MULTISPECIES: methyltransferase domain-containing protein [Myxococcus]QDE66906.1 RNA methyltransferase [Myxococcus xanthus]QDE74179.1 RNA methyltransferase [Myxococcus xanthus]QDE81444.1 RNA methyltransferase [Myxococcus xanthus]QDE95771.1 RNA methyltransferase [Myxococcus xanthus]QDF03081.1 RNA methyltransferase [Myxococcus xanthus]
MKRRMMVLASMVGMAANAASVSTAQQTVTVQVRGPSGGAIQAPDVPFVPTPEGAVDGMLALAGVKPGDTVYDLGSGDGRIVISAVQKHGAKHAVGVDINPERIAEANQNASQAGVKNKVEFRQGDLFDADISDASVVTLYLLPSVNERLKSKLLSELKPGTRIVSHSFDMGDWAPTKTVQSEGRTLYLWVVPERGTGGAPR